MRSVAFICLLFVYNVKSQDCCTLPLNLPTPLQNLLSLSSASPVSVSNIQVAPSCGIPQINLKTCGCPETNCGCIGSLIQAPVVPPCGCYNPAIGLQNPIIGVQSCGCTNSFGACTCGNPVVGNLCGRSTPAIGIATTCGCSDPQVRIVDGCPRCQPVYSYNLPSIGFPTCGCGSLGCGCGVPSYLPGISLPGCGCGCSVPYPYASCGCNGPCGCAALTCGCGLPSCGCGASCGCNGPCGCAPVNSCGCVEVPCGLPKVKTTCTCVTPTIETPCGCAQGKPTCACTTTLELPTCGVPVVPPFAPVLGCSRYLHQVVLQPPYL